MRSFRLSTQALTNRLSRLADLSAPELRSLHEARTRADSVPARTELQLDGKANKCGNLLLSGWAAHLRMLPDGRRQIVAFILPGETIPDLADALAFASTSILAITDLTFFPAPPAAEGSGLAHAYAASRALVLAQLFDNVTRLGRMNAQERICDLCLELLERLQLSGLAEGNSFATPLTQELFADAVGLTPVHLNRSLQACRRQGELLWRSGHITLHSPADLARQLGRRKPHPFADTADEMRLAEARIA